MDRVPLLGNAVHFKKQDQHVKAFQKCNKETIPSVHKFANVHEGVHSWTMLRILIVLQFGCALRTQSDERYSDFQFRWSVHLQFQEEAPWTNSEWGHSIRPIEWECP